MTSRFGAGLPGGGGLRRLPASSWSDVHPDERLQVAVVGGCPAGSEPQSVEHDDAVGELPYRVGLWRVDGAACKHRLVDRVKPHVLDLLVYDAEDHALEGFA